MKSQVFDSAADSAPEEVYSRVQFTKRLSVERVKSETKHRVFPSWRPSVAWNVSKPGSESRICGSQSISVEGPRQKNAFDADSNQSPVSSGKHNNPPRGSVIIFSHHLPVCSSFVSRHSPFHPHANRSRLPLSTLRLALPLPS